LTEENKDLETENPSVQEVEAQDATTEETTTSNPEVNAEESITAETENTETTEEPAAEPVVEEAPTAESTEETPAEPVAEEAPEAEAEATPEVVAEASEETSETSEKKKSKGPKQVAPLVHNEDDFDWSMDKEGFSTYDTAQKGELLELYNNTFNPVEELTVVKGKVVSMNKKDVVIDIGFKSDGLVNRVEFRDTPDLKVGDEVEVFVEKTEDDLGQLVLSRKKAIAETAWEKILDAKENNTIVNGYVKSRTKGGLVVDVLSLDAFLPGSQIDVKPIRDYDQYVGQTMEFKVVKVNEAFKNVVISHKALIEDDIEAQKGEILSRLEKGQVLEGIVKNMTSFGVFVDLGGLDGLLHITDVSWGRINHPEEVLELDQKINVVVLDFDDDKKRISLGLKQLSAHPWDNLDDQLQVNAKVKGKVVTVADYGAFVEIAAGIEGLIHVSEMSWSQHLRNPQDFMKVGDEIEAVILTLDKEEHKMSLGIKQLTPDPWEEIESKYPVGSKHTGIVRNLTNYGLFVELEEGVDGLVHVSDLSWSKKIKHPAEFTKKGEELEVIVLEIDRENRRLSLGHKQLDENPWNTFESIFNEGSEHEGTILEISDKGATVGMPYGVEAFAPTKHLKKEDKSNVKAEEALIFRVIEFNKDQKRIIVSHTDIWKEEERARIDTEKTETKKRAGRTAKIVGDLNKNVERSTLGELGGLAELKAKMEAASKDVKAPKKEAAKKAEPKAEKKEATKDEAPKKEAPSAEADDLKKLNGVGPAFEKKLIEAGITSYKQIADLDEAGITALEEAISKPGIVAKNGWQDQVKELMSA